MSDEDRPVPTTWTTRDGQTLPIRDMTDDHLIATIRYLRRRNYRTLLGISIRRSRAMISYAATAPDGAADAARSEIAFLSTQDGYDSLLVERLAVFGALLDEARHRKLKP